MKKVWILILTALLICAFSACSKKVKDAETPAAEDSVKTDDSAKDAAKAEESVKADEAKADDSVKAEDAAKMNGASEVADVNADEDISAEVKPKGLVMQIKGLPSDIELLDASGTVNGPYVYRYIYKDMVIFFVERLDKVESGIENVKKNILELESEREVLNLKAEPSKEIADVSYPVFKLTFRTGRNEDMRECLDYYIQADKFDYRLHFTTPADYVDEYVDFINKTVSGIELKQEG